MAQIPTTEQVTSSLTDGVDKSLSNLRSWSSTAFDRLRKSVLPDHEDHAYPLTTESASDHPSGRTIVQRIITLLPTMVMGLATLLLVIAIGLFVFRNLYHDRIYPAVVVGDVPVGGLTADEAESRLTERAAELEQGTIAFTYADQTWTPTLSELGATVDLDGSIAEAERLGRDADAASRLAFTGELLRADQVVPLQTTLDEGVLNGWFDRVDRELGQPAVNAQVVVSGTEVSVTADATGIVVDREAATAQILGALAQLQPVAVALPTQVDQPQIRAADLTEATANVEGMIATPIRVQFENRTWRIEGSTLAQYFLVSTVLENGKPKAVLSIDTDRLAVDLRAQFVPEVNREPKNASIAWSDNQGKLVATAPSETGITLKAGDFAEAVANGFLNGDRRIEVPVVVTRPTIDDENLDALGITSRLGRGDSNFAGGSWSRDQNIYVGTELLNGTLVPPGGEFSFNQAVGEITYEKGYQDAAVVVAEQIGRDVGGGICQVSTTVFRAAIFAGMPVTEWHPHTYRLKGYEADGWGPGFDASILQMGSDPQYWADFRFQNYTDGWLLVESWTSYPNVVVSIYGTDTGRDVEVNAWGINGKSTGFTRILYDADGNVIAERAFATYFK